MAVEATQTHTHTHLNPFTPQLILQNRDMVNEGIRFSEFPTLPAGNNNSAVPFICDSLQGNTDQSGLTYNIPVSRKRSIDRLYAAPNILPHLHQHHLDIDTIISQHSKRMRLEVQERQRQQAKLVVAAIGEEAMRKQKEKDERIQRIRKLNFVLEEKVKSLYVENQFWRELAQTNEAMANSLRTNIQQALAQAAEDVESCCGTTADYNNKHDEDGEGRSSEICYSDRRRCRRCGEGESTVLLLPCRHLCLCRACGSGTHQIQACPVCNSSMKATLHLNMSMP